MGDRGPARGRRRREVRALPSPVAVDRLRRALHAEVSACAEDLDRRFDPDDGTAGRGGDAAVRGAGDRLEVLQRRVQRLVAGAVAEREAEAVLSGAVRADPRLADPRLADAVPEQRTGPHRVHLPRRRHVRWLTVGAAVGALAAVLAGLRLTDG